MSDKASSGTDSRKYDRLLPCPFCSGEAEVHRFHDGDFSIDVYHSKDCILLNDLDDGIFDSDDYEWAVAAWNTRATHGTLTAEQVLEAWTGNLKRDCLYDPPIPDWQAIADELNATLGCGTCKNIAPSYLDFLCSECGFVHYHSEENDTGDGNEWHVCPNCGAKVKR